MSRKSNYAINPTPEQALRSNRAVLPARVIAALDLMRSLLAILVLTFAASSATACSCYDDALSDRTIRDAERIFVFRLVGAEVNESKELDSSLAETVGQIRVMEILKGDNSPGNEVIYNASVCCGVRLDVGNYYVAFLPGDMAPVRISSGTVLNISWEFSEGEFSASARESILNRLRRLVAGDISLDSAFSETERAWVISRPAKQVCPETIPE